MGKTSSRLYTPVHPVLSSTIKDAFETRRPVFHAQVTKHGANRSSRAAQVCRHGALRSRKG